MSALFLTLPVALMLGALGLYACIRCIKSGQYDDLDTQAMRILQDEQREIPTSTHPSDSQSLHKS
jgi:cbb3-type cytochrome oxidase maturation protein